MGEIQKLVIGVLVFSFALTTFSNFYRNMANVHSVGDFSNDTITTLQSDMNKITVIDQKFENVSSTLGDDPSASGGGGSIPDILGLVINSGITAVKSIFNSADELYSIITNVGGYLGIPSDVTAFFVTLAGVIMAFALIKVVSGRLSL